LSKSRNSIYYKKRRGEPYRTLSIDDALRRAVAASKWPVDIDGGSIVANVRMLSIYRDNAIHFYNDANFSALLYSLTQTSIINFRDVLKAIGGRDIARDITWSILPLSVDRPLDPIAFLRRENNLKRGPAVDEFISALKEEEQVLEATGGDTGRLLTIYNVNLQSIKKIDQADVVVGIDPTVDGKAILIKPVDPNKSHPWRQKDLLGRLELPFRFGQYEFLVVTTQLGLRTDPRYCWTDKDVNLVRWSPDTLNRIAKLSEEQVAELRSAYQLSQTNARRQGSV
jgi:EC042_2821-lke REase